MVKQLKERKLKEVYRGFPEEFKNQIHYKEFQKIYITAVIQITIEIYKER
ncbi:hypothetical protein [Thermosipho sp. (in: thermotogales)]|jgi:hypothetical protein|nr:hypothetical protein [Thermosipho sp. (in: thermotogales)]MBZ4649202.1 hypothetical protein [Thermosipho sp. (in: thermotogales)]